MNGWPLVTYIAVSADYVFLIFGALEITFAWAGRRKLYKLIEAEKFSEEMMCDNEWADLCGTTSLAIGSIFFVIFALVL